MSNNRIINEDLESIYHSPIDWNQFTNKVVLISGANGFLPAYMVESLIFANKTNLKLNLRILALVRNLDKAKKRFSDHLDNYCLEFIEGDVCDKISINLKVDYIIHAASQASPKYYGTDPVGTLSANVIGTMNMLELAKIHNVDSFLYFSSGEIYGQVPDERNPVSEDYYGYLDPTNVRSCYAESKRMGENMCVSYFHQYNVKAKVVRPFHTYGPGMDLTDGRVYADFVADVIAGRNIQMKSDGSARRAFCYLKDATIAFFSVLLNGIDAEAYNVGNPTEEYSIFELALIIAPLGLMPLQVIPNKTYKNTNLYLRSSISRNTPDINKLAALGWFPHIKVEEGFKRTIESYSKL